MIAFFRIKVNFFQIFRLRACFISGQDDNLMKHLSLHVRFCSTLAITAFAGVLVLGMYGYFAQKGIVESNIEEPILAEIKQSADHIAIVLQERIEDMRAIIKGPLVRGFFESQPHEDGDPQFHIPSDTWKTLLLDLFVETLKGDRYFSKIEFIDTEGKEILCLRKSGSLVHVEGFDELMNEADRDYFIESRNLPHGW